MQNTDILCAQESLLCTHSNFWIKGFNLIRKDIVSSNERDICILIKHNIPFNTLDLSSFFYSSVEVQGISISVDNEPLAIINIYRHPNQHTPFAFYDCYNSLTQTSLTLLSWVNAHYTRWGCDFDDQAGKTLSRIIEIHELQMIEHLLFFSP